MSTGTVPSTGPAFDAFTIANALTNGDGTVTLSGTRYNGSGILVAIPEYSAVIEGIDSVDFAGIVEWVEENASAITGNPAPFFNPRYFGVWADGDTLYLDIVEAFPREEKDAAIAAGIARNQIAIWDNGRSELIETGGTGAVD
jgi:hypothetical protein